MTRSIAWDKVTHADVLRAIQKSRPRLTARFTLASRRSLRRKRLAPHAKLRSP
jgi:hypothetical protein